MTDLDRLLAAIIANPDDNAVRLVYADKIQDLDTEEARARADFIRVQVELANFRKTRVDRGFLIVDDVSEDALRERERELFLHSFPKSRHLFGDCNITYCLPNSAFARREATTDEPIAIVSRGFIAEVHGPLAALVGGETTRSVYERGEYGPNRYQETIRTPAVLPAIAQAWPVERVEVTDAVIHRSGGNDTYYVGGLGRFPKEFWRALEGHRTASAARAALSAALIRWARSQVI